MTVTILIFLPLLAAFALIFSKNQAAKYLALGFSLFELAVAAYFVAKFVPDDTLQFAADYAWIPKLGIHFNVGLDGINIIPVILCTLLVPIIILTTFKHFYNKAPIFYALILFMQAGMMTVFIALDGFLFYVGWEAALIPIYFISALWGGENRIKVTLKFFIYTFAGSLFMLAALVYLYVQNPSRTFDLQEFYLLNLTGIEQSVIFWAFFVAFAIKMPLFPFHTWQPDTYTESPSGGTMMLSGIMLKMGVYGVIRWIIPIVPAGFNHWYPLAITLAVTGIIYASVIAFRQKDGKRLVAYSSIAHVGLIAAGVFALNVEGLQGSMIQMLNHGINVVGLFFVWDIISRRMNTRNISELGGIAKVAPWFAVSFLIILLGTVALPLTNGFIGEFLLLNSLYHYNLYLSIVAGTTIILGAVYMLRMYKGVMQGPTNDLTITFTDISGSEKAAMLIICLLIIVIGLYPQPILHLSEGSVNAMIQFIKDKLASQTELKIK